MNAKYYVGDYCLKYSWIQNLLASSLATHAKRHTFLVICKFKSQTYANPKIQLCWLIPQDRQLNQFWPKSD